MELYRRGCGGSQDLKKEGRDRQVQSNLHACTGLLSAVGALETMLKFVLCCLGFAAPGQEDDKTEMLASGKEL